MIPIRAHRSLVTGDILTGRETLGDKSLLHTVMTKVTFYVVWQISRGFQTDDSRVARVGMSCSEVLYGDPRSSQLQRFANSL